MRIPPLLPALLLVTLGVAACAENADDFGSLRRRGINADIASVHETGPTALYPGQRFDDVSEPKGVYPWQLDERH